MINDHAAATNNSNRLNAPNNFIFIKFCLREYEEKPLTVTYSPPSECQPFKKFFLARPVNSSVQRS